MEAIVGRNVTLKTLLDKPVYSFIVWNFNDGSEQTNIATLTKSSLKAREGYEGRASIDSVTGSLSLTGLKPDDSGDYSISIISEDGTTRTAEIKLLVLGESARSSRPLTCSCPRCVATPVPHGFLLLRSFSSDCKCHRWTLVLSTCSGRGAACSCNRNTRLHSL